MPGLDPKCRKPFKLMRAVRNYVWWSLVRRGLYPEYFVNKFIEAGEYDPVDYQHIFD